MNGRGSRSTAVVMLDQRLLRPVMRAGLGRDASRIRGRARDGLWRGPASGRSRATATATATETAKATTAAPAPAPAPQQAARATPTSAAARQRVARPDREGIAQSGSNVFPDRGKGGARRGRSGDDQSRPWMAGGRKWEQDSADSGWASPLRPRRAAAARTTPTRTSPRLGEEPIKKPRRCGAFRTATRAGQRRIEAKNSSLDLVVFILSSRNSIAAISSIGCSSLRRIQIFCSSSGSISRSSRRVPDWLTLIAG